MLGADPAEGTIKNHEWSISIGSQQYTENVFELILLMYPVGSW